MGLGRIVLDLLWDWVGHIIFTVDNLGGSIVSVIGVYLPCLYQGLDMYRECLEELEGLNTEYKLLGPVIVGGDRHHVGGLGGP